MAHHHDKGRRYIDLLDVARCDGSWNDIPELVRKVTKHAPERKCLIQTATAENQVARHSTLALNHRSAASSIPPDLIPSLVSAADSEPAFSEEVFQAQTCLGWLHSTISDPGVAATKFPRDLRVALVDMTSAGRAMSDWTETCLVKAAYLKGSVQIKAGRSEEALQTFNSIAQWMHDHRSKIGAQTQLTYWSEQLLARLALSASTDIDFRAPESASQVESALQAFRHWAIYSARSRDIGPATFGNTQAPLSKIYIFKAYYQFLIRLLQHGNDHTTAFDHNSRLEQATEIRKIQTMYESELLRVTQFPKAHESNATIEEWVEQVIQNWEILCGPDWHDEELGEGGRNGVGRGVLDVLYRAATKTFHSTLILRRLFQVHKSLADFDLAYKALDSYLELIERGIKRAEKSNEQPVGQDNIEVVLRTISEGIEGLCAFGTGVEAEKAFELSTKLEEWIEQSVQEPLNTIPVNGHKENELSDRKKPKISLSPETLSLAHRAVGIGRACWARWTPVSENRTSLQNEAIIALMKSAGQARGDEDHLRSVYALGLMLAETRDINRAIENVRNALRSNEVDERPDRSYSKERKLIPLWHLLALLLSGRQDFEIASQACAAAFEQFPSPKTLFGSGRQDNPTQADPEKQTSRGLVDDMECRELETIIEIRMTELALTEISEGPEEAVNSSDELLSLFSRLFGHLGIGIDDRSKAQDPVPPKSSAGTAHSFRGSIFGRRTQARTSFQISGNANGVSTADAANPVNPSPPRVGAPKIQVTDENDKTRLGRVRRSHHFEHSHGDGHHSHKLRRREGSLSRIIRRNSKDRKSVRSSSVTSNQSHSFEKDGGEQNVDTSTSRNRDSLRPEDAATAAAKSTEPQVTAGELPVANHLKSTHDSPPQAHKPLPPVPHNVPHNDEPPPSGHATQPPKQDVHLPMVHAATLSTQPRPRFPKSALQKHALSILIKIWVVVAGLYRRALMFDDSREACDEAAKAALRVESIVSTQESSAAAFADRGWGGAKSSDELWADVFCEKGQLALAKGQVHEAVEQLEQALMYWPDHARTIIVLADVLLDVYDQKVTSEGRVKGTDEVAKWSEPVKEERPSSSKGTGGVSNGSIVENGASTTGQGNEDLRKTPENLNRLAARDRAYGLLSTLTKLGTGWDDSEAWFALARANESSGQIEKAKEVLWYCVELEDRRPVRHWRNLGSSGYVL